MYDLKNRADSKALISLVASEIMLERTVIDMPDIAWDLIDAAEKPLTIIYQEVKGIAHNVIAEDGSCAIACQKIIFANNLCKNSENSFLPQLTPVELQLLNPFRILNHLF